ncbi:MAG: DUF3418 domain-containing protein, partial [Planctomycetota bacterium]
MLPPDGGLPEPVAPLVDDARYVAIHTALLTGLMSGIAMRSEERQYQGAGGNQFFLWPGSGVLKARRSLRSGDDAATDKTGMKKQRGKQQASTPLWVMSGERIETSRAYMRTIADIQPDWLERLAGHLTKRHYADPHFSAKTGGASCYETVTLFGLPIVAKRRIALAPIDPGGARILLIEQGLVDGHLTTRAAFVRSNASLLSAIADLAAKTRGSDLVVDPFVLQRIYQDRLPESVVDRRSLEEWDRQQSPPSWVQKDYDSQTVLQLLQSPESSGAPGGPYLHPCDVLPNYEREIDASTFPDAIEIGHTRLPLEYRFEPGGENDGVTLTVPAAALPQVSPQRLGWLVPGLLRAKVMSMIKALP